MMGSDHAVRTLSLATSATLPSSCPSTPVILQSSGFQERMDWPPGRSRLSGERMTVLKPSSACSTENSIPPSEVVHLGVELIGAARDKTAGVAEFDNGAGRSEFMEELDTAPFPRSGDIRRWRCCNACQAVLP